MSWVHVLLAGYTGAVIAVAVGMFRKKGQLGKISGVVVSVVTTIAWGLFDAYYLIPRENPDYGLTEEQQFEKAMFSNPAFQVVKGQEPELTQKTISQTVQTKKAGSSE